MQTTTKLLLLFLLFSIPGWNLYSQTGPAGVGNTSNNGLWLRAGDLGQANGTIVPTWSDISGNGNDAVQGTAGTQPLFFSTSAMNNQPIVRFDGINDEMVVADDPILDGSAGITFYAAIRPNNLTGAPRGILGKRVTFTVSVEYAYTWFFWSGNRLNNDVHTQNNRYNSGGNTFGNATNYILSFDFDGSLAPAQRSRMFSQGSPIAVANETSTALPNSNQPLALGALNVGYGTYLGADYGEVIHFNYSLDSVEHILIQNYLSAKYNIGLNVHDFYDEDDPANGNYDFEVAGIGQIIPSVSHDDSQGSAILRINNPSDLGNDEFMIWGHDNGVEQAIEFGDVPAGVISRFDRVWRVSEVNSSASSVDVGAVDISFDLSALLPVTEGDLRLLIDANNNGIFSDDVPVTGASHIGSNVYQFTGVTGLQDNLRFTLGTINTNQTPLPVELINFTASAQENSTVLLNWETASEADNDFFAIERSKNGIEWESVDTVQGIGNANHLSTYNYVDNRPLIGHSYYRLKQHDFNGDFEYSPVRSVNLQLEEEYLLYPNPASNQISLVLHGKKVNIIVFDQSGRTVKSEYQIEGETYILDLNQLESGSYFLQINEKNRVINRDFVVL
jgi:hypothetical protein